MASWGHLLLGETMAYLSLLAAQGSAVIAEVESYLFGCLAAHPLLAF